jgi:hypothetical protein
MQNVNLKTSALNIIWLSGSYRETVEDAFNASAIVLKAIFN